MVVPESTPLDFQIVGRTLFHAAIVGVAAGLIGAGFFAGLEYLQRLLLEGLAGYVPLRADGERFLAESAHIAPFRPWLLVAIPAAGALLGGLVSQLAPETRGGGGDAMIDAFHHRGGEIRPRVIPVKIAASFLTLGAGGAGGREGPTMQIGGALGALLARFIKVSPVERRMLLVAGVAAGMAAVFRTPLGAALLAIEVLYRDDFEAEALIPAILAAVISYSVVISIYGETTLFAHAPRYPFTPAHLPLYGLLAIFVALLAVAFVKTLRLVQRLAARVPGPTWIRPGLGGLALGAVAVPAILLMRARIGVTGQGLGILGGGYGAAQTAITGAHWLPHGWGAVELLLVLCAVKLIAASLTIGSGGSAGDFAPSLVLGAIFGGAFGRAAQLLLHDPRIDPGAFALVGMGTFYGGIAHVPISSLIFVCELAGSYDLLVPLMLAEGIAFVALRRHSLYHAQVPTRRDSPAHRGALELDVLLGMRVADVLTRGRPYLEFGLGTPAREIAARAAESTWQDAFPIVDAGVLKGLVTAETLRALGQDREAEAWMIGADVMQPPVSLLEDDSLRRATEALLGSGLREVPVLGADGAIVGFLDESDIARAYLEKTATRDRAATGG